MYHHCRHVVPAPPGERPFDQCLGLPLRRAAALERLRDLRLRHAVAQAVAAQQEAVSGFQLHFWPQLRLQRHLLGEDAQVLGQLVPRRMPLGLLRREHAQLHQLLRPVVVPGQARQRAAPQQVNAAVAEIAAQCPVSGDVQRRQRGAHARAQRAHLRANFVVRGPDAGLGRPTHVPEGGRAQGPDCGQRGRLAPLRAAHAVRHCRQKRPGRARIVRAVDLLLHAGANPVLQVIVVLVVAAHASGVAEDESMDFRRHRGLLSGGACRPAIWLEARRSARMRRRSCGQVARALKRGAGQIEPAPRCTGDQKMACFKKWKSPRRPHWESPTDRLHHLAACALRRRGRLSEAAPALPAAVRQPISGAACKRVRTGSARRRDAERARGQRQTDSAFPFVFSVNSKSILP